MSSQNTRDIQKTGGNSLKPSSDASVDPSPSSNFRVGGILSSISASASALLSSVSSPSITSITDSLTSSSNLASTKPSDLQNPSSSTSTHSSSSFSSSRNHHTSFSSSSSSSLSSSLSEVQGFRSHQPSQLYSKEDEFAHFSRPAPIQPHTPQKNHPALPLDDQNTQRLASDGQDVISLLSQPLTQSIYSPSPEFYGINIAHPAIHLFTTCDDPVEYLSTTDIYTKEVWGDSLEVVLQAREEVLGDKKGKRKQDSGRTATERLKMIWGHLKGAGV